MSANLSVVTVLDHPIVDGLTPEQYQYLMNPQMAVDNDISPESLLLPYIAVINGMRERLHDAIDAIGRQDSLLDGVAHQWAKLPKSSKYSGITGVTVPLVASGILFAVPPLAFTAFGAAGTLLILGHLFDQHYHCHRDSLQRVRETVGGMMDFLALLLTFMLRIGHGLQVQVDRFCSENQRLRETNDSFTAQVTQLTCNLRAMHEEVCELSSQRKALVDTVTAENHQSRIAQQLLGERCQKNAIAIEGLVKTIQPLFESMQSRANQAEQQRKKLDCLLRQMMVYQAQQQGANQQLHEEFKRAISDNSDNFERITREFDQNNVLLEKATLEVQCRSEELARTQQAFQDLKREYQGLLQAHRDLMDDQGKQLDTHRSSTEELKLALEAHRDVLRGSGSMVQTAVEVSDPRPYPRSSWYRLLGGKLVKTAKGVVEDVTTKVTL